jgi:hypothetical protein
MIGPTRATLLVVVLLLLTSVGTTSAERARMFRKYASLTDCCRFDTEHFIAAPGITRSGSRFLMVEAAEAGAERTGHHAGTNTECTTVWVATERATPDFELALSPLHRRLASAEGAEDAPEMPAFPPSLVTKQDKIEWLAAEIDSDAQSIVAESEKPRLQQREALYRRVLARAAGLTGLMNRIEGEGRLPRLAARLNELEKRAQEGLERIANARLTIGMSIEQVRQIRGEPLRIAEIGLRQQWQYGRTVLSFENGKLVEIRQMLNE